jgi:hypothetical protein
MSQPVKMIILTGTMGSGKTTAMAEDLMMQCWNTFLFRMTMAK